MQGYRVRRACGSNPGAGGCAPERPYARALARRVGTARAGRRVHLLRPAQPRRPGAQPGRALPGRPPAARLPLPRRLARRRALVAPHAGARLPGQRRAHRRPPGLGPAAARRERPPLRARERGGRHHEHDVGRAHPRPLRLPPAAALAGGALRHPQRQPRRVEPARAARARRARRLAPRRGGGNICITYVSRTRHLAWFILVVHAAPFPPRPKPTEARRRLLLVPPRGRWPPRRRCPRRSA